MWLFARVKRGCGREFPSPAIPFYTTAHSTFVLFPKYWTALRVTSVMQGWETQEGTD
jgi:hypothetical protein